MAELSTDFKIIPGELKAQIKKEITDWLDDNADWKDLVSI